MTLTSSALIPVENELIPQHDAAQLEQMRAVYGAGDYTNPEDDYDDFQEHMRG